MDAYRYLRAALDRCHKFRQVLTSISMLSDVISSILFVITLFCTGFVDVGESSSSTVIGSGGSGMSCISCKFNFKSGLYFNSAIFY